jgi:sugar phosphate isomerase/epimerase
VPDDILATCWTSAGPVDPTAPDARSPFDPVARIEALARAGFTGVDLLLADLEGRDLDAVAAAFYANGIVHRQIELVRDWWLPEGEPSVALALRLAGALGVTQIKAAADLDHPHRPMWEMRDAWVRFADRAAEVGAQLVVEPLPFSNLASIEQGARFVQGAGHPNGGIVVDYWHVRRGGSTPASLAQHVDPAHLLAVELCDGDGPKPVGLTMLEDANTRRMLPGDGTWDVAGFVRTLRDMGFAGPWGVEMVAPWFGALPLAEAASRAGRATRRVLNVAV